MLGVVLSMAACAGEEPEIVKAAEFKEHYERVGMAETMRSTRFLGVERGVALIEVQKMRILGKGWKSRRIGIPLGDLPPALRKAVEEAARKLGQQGDSSGLLRDDPTVPMVSHGRAGRLSLD